MDLAKLRVYLATEYGEIVLVIGDGTDRFTIRTNGDPDFLGLGAARLQKGADELAAAVAQPAAVGR